MRKVMTFIFVVFFCCTETHKQEITVTGALLKYDSKLAVPNTRVFIELGDEISYFDPKTSRIDGHIHFTNSALDSTVSNALGQFFFKVDPNKHRIFRLGVAKEYVILGNSLEAGKLLDSKLSTETLLVGSASNLRLIIKSKVPKNGDAISIFAMCIPPDENGLSRNCLFEVDDRVDGLTDRINPKSVTFQFLSDMFKEAKLNIDVTKGQEIVKTTKVIPLIDKNTVEYLIEY